MENTGNENTGANIVPYTIQNGYFSSTFTSPRHILEFKRQDSNRVIITRGGDTLLRIWATTNFKFAIGDCKFESVNGEVKFFEGGIPLIGQYSGFIFIYTEGVEKVFAEFENYDDTFRKKLATFQSESDQSQGVKLRGGSNGQSDHIIGGRGDPGHSVNTLYKISTPNPILISGH